MFAICIIVVSLCQVANSFQHIAFVARSAHLQQRFIPPSQQLFVATSHSDTKSSSSSSARELPYEVLNECDDYEVRKYPSSVAIQINYDSRRDAFKELESVTSAADIKPYAPSIIRIPTSGSDSDTPVMLWPLEYAKPGQDARELRKIRSTAFASSLSDNSSGGTIYGCNLVNVPESVMAVAKFDGEATVDAAKQADAKLREACQRDGIRTAAFADHLLEFAQYPAIFNVGERPHELWISLENEPKTS